MIAIPQCLDFSDIRLTREICDFYLKMLQIKNREIYLHSQQVANYAASTVPLLVVAADDVRNISKLRNVFQHAGPGDAVTLINGQLPSG